MRIDEILTNAAREAPNEPALLFEKTQLSFAALEARVDQLALALSNRLAAGERVAVLAENHPAVVESYYGVPRAGLGLVLLNYRLAPREIVAALIDSGARVLIGERALLDPLATFLDDAPALRETIAIDSRANGEALYEDLLQEDGEALYEDVLQEVSTHLIAKRPVHAISERRAATTEADLAWLIYTSGTTGRPKGTMLSHRNLVTAALMSALGRPVEANDVYLYPFPLCHVSGHNLYVLHLQRRPVVLLRRFDPDAVCDAIATHCVSTMSLAPTMLSMLLDSPALGRCDTGSLRSIGYGASAIPAEILRQGIERLGCDFGQGYGMTELSGNAVFLDAKMHRRGLAGEPHLLRAAGRPGPLIAMRILDQDGQDVAAGHVGEVAFRGDQVTQGYWQNSEATVRAFQNGWFLTGDIGRRDQEGILYLVDRKKDLIVSGGENVSSREVEDVLHLHPAVREAAVIGRPDPKWGECVCAVVVRRPGVAAPEADTEAELIALVREHLASYKKPQRFFFADDLPKNASGKILKNELREQYSG